MKRPRYAEVDFLGGGALRECSHHLNSYFRWVVLTTPIAIALLSYVQALVMNFRRAPLPGWPLPTTSWVLFSQLLLLRPWESWG